MPTVEIVSNEYITMRYERENGMISHTFHQPIGEEQKAMFKESFDLATETLRKNGVTKWLSDDRKNGPLSNDLVEWAQKDWTPRTIEAGWKYWANVVPEEIAAAGTLVPIMNELHNYGLRMRVFTDVESAREWLASLG